MNFIVLLLLACAAVTSPWAPATWRYRAVAVSTSLLLAAGLWIGAMSPIALIWMAALFGSAWWAARQRPLRMLAWVLFVAFALGIGFGLLPGFTAIPYSSATLLKPESLPYTLQIGLGKPLVAIALLLWLVPVSQKAEAWKSAFRRALPLSLATSAIALPLAWARGYVRPSVAAPPLPQALCWMLINLLLVCVVEEGFFRGLVQRSLAAKMHTGAAMVASAALFGLIHFAGGWPYVLVAAIAGVGYGLAYQLSGQRIEAAMLTHFGVNLAHFSLFTYPAAA